jgi:hypothetical protein
LNICKGTNLRDVKVACIPCPSAILALEVSISKPQ